MRHTKSLITNTTHDRNRETLAAYPALPTANASGSPSGTSSNHSERDHQCSDTEAHRIRRQTTPDAHASNRGTHSRNRDIRQRRRRHRDRQSGRAVERSPQKQPTPRLAPQVCCALIERCPVGNHSVLRSARADARIETRPRSHLWRTQAPTTARGRRVSGWHRVQPPAAPAQAALSNRGRLHAAPRCRGQAANLESSASRPVRPTVLASSLILRTTPRRACACATALSVFESSSDVVPSEFNGGKT